MLGCDEEDMYSVEGVSGITCISSASMTYVFVNVVGSE